MRPYVSEVPYISHFQLSSSDEFLIIACDGVWDEISDQEAVGIVGRESRDPFDAALKLRDFAYLLGSEDNISVAVIFLKNLEEFVHREYSKLEEFNLNEDDEFITVDEGEDNGDFPEKEEMTQIGRLEIST